MKETIKQALSEAIVKLKKNEIPTPQLDAEVLLAHTLHKSREYIISHPKEKLSESLITSYALLVTRRSRSEPIAYIVGHKEFYGLDFFVTKDTLIPRPETELLVEEALVLLRSMLRSMLHKNIFVIDVGTGSGNIIISLIKSLSLKSEIGNLKFIAVDPSRKALEIAQNNSQKHNVSEKITFLGGRFLNPLMHDPSIEIQNSTIIILANLPYLSKNIYNSSPTSVKDYEPKESLLSSNDGLDHYRKLFNQIRLLAVEQRLPVVAFFEISPEQKSLIIREIKSHLPNASIRFKKDLAGKWRLVTVKIKLKHKS